jgi:hypothetical protein
VRERLARLLERDSWMVMAGPAGGSGGAIVPANISVGKSVFEHVGISSFNQEAC